MSFDPTISWPSVSGTSAAGRGNDAGPSWIPEAGNLPINGVLTAATAVDITALAGAGLTQVIDDILISSDTATIITIDEHDGSSSLRTLMRCIVPANLPIQITLRNGIRGLTANTKLRITSSATATCYGTIAFHKTS